MSHRFFTSESVTEGHPDKVCDQISDAVLDAILKGDKSARVACETIVTTGMILVMGEITADCYVDIPQIARETVKDIGYVRPELGFDHKGSAVLTTIDEQSPDIAMGVNSANDDKDDEGAGDQGMMFGFACDETPEFMPAPISIAHALTRRLAEARKSGELGFIRPDGKSQVTVEYDEDRNVVGIPTIVVSTQHEPDISIEDLRESVAERIIKPVIPEKLLSKDTRILVNPTGRFVVGGPAGDSGLTGRKIIVDSYGGYANHGGGAFSGKDPSKVDRSAAYMARYVAKNVVAAGLARACQIELAYAIGVAKPVSIHIDTRGTGVFSDEKIAGIVKENFDFRPSKIISRLDLLRPIYRATAAYGHFGRNETAFTWEKLDMVDTLKNYL
ncbi:MAG: methionine adenosyltransferase [Oscillospiraceae bacterium]|nr:methionine adenosyltransferase [Oscillospiraceae bacterium]